jgi:hypothetical protein
MPIGDNDIASGVFFRDFAVHVEFAGQPTAKGNFDAPGKDAMFGSNTSVSDSEYRLEVSYVAFSPMPDVRSRLVVDGVPYIVTSSSPLDDGKTVEILMRKL